jgi:hypothetical protein
MANTFSLKALIDRIQSNYPWVRSAVLVTLLGLLIFSSQFSQVQYLGLYEDDYDYVAETLTYTPKTFFSILEYILTHWPQGRPLGFGIPKSIVFVFHNLGLGVFSLYLLSFLILTANAGLAFCIFRRLFNNVLSAFLGAALFAFFPALTTRSFLMHNLSLQISLLFLLLAIWLILKGKNVLSYLAAFLILLTYETPFTLLYALPLLTHQGKLNREWVKKTLVHALILTAILAAYMGARSLLQDERMGQLSSSLLELPWIMIQSAFIGAFTSFRSVFFGINTFLNAAEGSSPVFGVSLLVLLLGFSFAGQKGPQPEEAVSGSPSSRPHARRLLRIGIAGILCLGLGYLLPFTHFPPIKLAGRLTSIHLPAGLGFSLVLTSLFTFLYLQYKKPIQKHILTAGAILLIAAFSGYHHVIQRDMVRSFFNQQWFWTHIVQQCPQFEDGTVVIVEKDTLPKTTYIQSFSWADPYILNYLYHFPDTWEQAPTVLTLNPGWEEHLVREDDQWIYPWNAYFSAALQDEKVLWLRYNPALNIFYDLQEPIITPEGEQIQTREIGLPGDCRFETTAVHPILINPDKLDSEPR